MVEKYKKSNVHFERATQERVRESLLIQDRRKQTRPFMQCGARLLETADAPSSLPMTEFHNNLFTNKLKLLQIFKFYCFFMLFYSYFFASTKKITKKSSLTNVLLNFTSHSLNNLNSQKTFLLVSYFELSVKFQFISTFATAQTADCS